MMFNQNNFNSMWHDNLIHKYKFHNYCQKVIARIIVPMTNNRFYLFLATLKKQGSTVSNLIFVNFNYWWISIIREGSTRCKHNSFFPCSLCIDDVLANFISNFHLKVAPRWEFNSQQFQQMSIKFSFISLDLFVNYFVPNISSRCSSVLW